MNKKGQQVFVFIMVAVMVLIFAITISKPLLDQTATTMNSTHMNCSDSSISTVKKTTCNILDMGFFYFISVCIATGLALLAGKRTITSILTTIMVFVVTVMLISPLKDLIILFRDSSHLDCSATIVTVGTRLTCIFVDLWLFYFFAVAIGAGIAFVFAKKVIKVE